MSADEQFTILDDGLHAPSDNFYETETFWYSFFVPERNLGGWLYTSLRANAGTCAGGAWIWDDRAAEPWRIPFFEQYSWLRYSDQPDGPQRLSFPTGMTIDVREPLMSYDLGYSDRDRLAVELRFDALEAPVPLRSGTPPYPKAHHFDQTGHLTGTIVLDGETINVDCYGMRDRSWGRRQERGSMRIGYVWAAAPEVTFLTYSLPTTTLDNIHTGYLRIGDEVAHIAGGSRRVERDPSNGWVTAMVVDAVDELGRALHAEGRAASRMILPGSASICINTSMEWTINGTTVHGEDQDVWPLKDYQARRHTQ
ncbi:MAG: hypothetical protein RLZZ623_2857 [Actinomycetota bacterium]|jgi:hypothetical protein